MNILNISLWNGSRCEKCENLVCVNVSNMSEYILYIWMYLYINLDEMWLVRSARYLIIDSPVKEGTGSSTALLASIPAIFQNVFGPIWDLETSAANFIHYPKTWNFHDQSSVKEACAGKPPKMQVYRLLTTGRQKLHSNLAFHLTHCLKPYFYFHYCCNCYNC